MPEAENKEENPEKKKFSSASESKTTAKKTEAKEETPKKETPEKKESSWTKLKPKELEEKIIELAKKGNSPSKIGLILRDQHAVPKTKQLLNNKISRILKESNTEYKTDKIIIQDNIKTLKVHIEKNKHDHKAQHSLARKLWQIRKLEAEAQ